MAKQYAFSFGYFPITYSPYGYVSEMSLMAARPTEHKTCTFAEAVAYLPIYGAAQSGTVPSGTIHAYIGMQNRRDRVPPGFNDDSKSTWNTPRSQALLMEDAAGNIIDMATRRVAEAA